jgi:hypothetical protein
MGQSGPRQNKDQTQLQQQGMAARLGQERGFISRWFLRCCDVTTGLMALYSTFPNLTQEEKDRMNKAWDLKKYPADVTLKIRPDGAVLLDVAQRLDRLFKFLNMTVKSGFINPKSVIVEATELTGLDPAKVVVDPKPPEPEPVNVSYRASGKDDLMNPLVLAMLMQGKRLPPPEIIDAAKQLLLTLDQPPKPPQQPGQPGQPGAPGAPAGPGGPPKPGMAPGGPPNAHPEWTIMDKVAKRSQDAKP